ncbi:MAG TPA: ABC transporter permease [Steroidobacteraceae bacterium]
MRHLPLVWAAVWRSRTESLLSFFALTIAFTLFGSMLALNRAYEAAISDARLDRLLVVRRFEGGGIPVAFGGQLERIKGVTAVGGQLWFSGHQEDPKQGIQITFVDEGMQAAWPELPMTPADWRNLDQTTTGVFLTKTAAVRRNVKSGDTIHLITAPGSRADGGTTWPFKVLGIIADPPGFGQWNPDMIIANLRYWHGESDAVENNFVLGYRLAVDSPQHSRAVCRDIEARFTNASPALSCVPAKDDAEEYAEANINMRQISLEIAAAGLFMILFLSSSSMAESVRIRLKEFGVLSTIGYRRITLALLVFAEAAIPTVLAALFGGALAALIDAYVAHLAVQGAIDMPRMRLSPAPFGWALGIALLVAMISSASPLLRIRSMEVGAIVSGR